MPVSTECAAALLSFRYPSYFVEYLHFDNNRRLDGFLNHKNNMYILNNKYDARKEICDKLYKK